MTTALNEWSKQDWKMIQCSRGVLKTLLNLKKERGRYHLRFDFKVWATLKEGINHKKVDGLPKIIRKV